MEKKHKMQDGKMMTDKEMQKMMKKEMPKKVKKNRS